MSENLQNTNYKGATVSSNLAFALKQTPVGKELFTFEERGKETLMQARFPEMGRYTAPAGKQPDPALEGREFNIRVNMNYLTKGMVCACMDKNGNLDPNKVEELDYLRERIFESEGEEKEAAFREFVNKMNVPEGKRAEFELFLKANMAEGSPLLLNGDTSPIHQMMKEVNGHLVQYQAAISGQLGPEAREYAEQYREQYENTMQSYREMARMDPEKETRILCPMDCLAFAYLTEKFVKDNNAYREAHGKPTYQVNRVDMNFQDQVKEAEAQGKEVLYGTHHFLTTDIDVSGPSSEKGWKDYKYTVTLENTAPAFGDVFHCPDVQRVGVGFYKNREAAEQYHRARNVKEIKGKEEFEKILSFKAAKKGSPLPKVTMPKEKTFHNYIRLHTGNVVDDLPEEKLHEYAAKITAALYYQKKGGKFDLSSIHSAGKIMSNSPNFRAGLGAMPTEDLRSMLRSGNVQQMAQKIIGSAEERYKIDRLSAEKLAKYHDMMETKDRSDEWKALKKAVGEAGTNSAPVFDAVEKYLKGKKKVRRSREGKDSVDLALNILAAAASSGDRAARERAGILVDRINEVRGTKPGDRYYVDLKDYPKVIRSLEQGPKPIEFDDVLLDDEGRGREARPAGKGQQKKSTVSGAVSNLQLAEPIEYEDVLVDEEYEQHRKKDEGDGLIYNPLI